MKSQLEEYFRKFIVDVQGLTMSSANHYAQALRTCSQFLRDEKLISSDVYAVDTDGVVLSHYYSPWFLG